MPPSERFVETIEAWEDAAHQGEQDRQSAIHPTGALAPEEYSASGEAAAQTLGRIASDYCYRDDGQPLRVLDFACGDGRVLQHLPEVWTIHGCDASLSMLNACGDTLASRRNVSLWPWDASTLFPHLMAARFHLVYALAVLIHHNPSDAAGMVHNLASALHTGGILVLDVPLSEEATMDGGGWINVSQWSHEFFLGVAWASGLELIPDHGPWHVLRRNV